MERRSVDVVVISDVHLGTYGCRAAELVNYLKSVTPSILILNGDIIDGWQFSKNYFPPAHINVIREIMNMITNGTRVFYITGNHDELLRRYADIQVGNFMLTDKLVLEIDNKMTWIFHGDVFDNTIKGSARFLAKLGSNGYAMLIQLNRLINYFLRLAGRGRISLSQRVMESVNKAVSKINDFETTAAEIAIAKKYDYVICGHIHQPQKRVISNKSGDVTYLNSGDWIEHLTALEYAHNEWSIYKYDSSNFTAEYQAESRQKTTVITDEISFYISSLAI
ncbi:MAG TPA: UDP-2,3-diacylglucosamine diphosphatase [Chitinophagaceae bacterium]